jgi:hypothetical protein
MSALSGSGSPSLCCSVPLLLFDPSSHNNTRSKNIVIITASDLHIPTNLILHILSSGIKMMTSTSMTTFNDETSSRLTSSLYVPSVAASSSVSGQMEVQQRSPPDLVLSVDPIIHATKAFSQTIALNNAGARHLERGNYEASIKALTASFLSFKKAYTNQKTDLVSLRTLIQESERNQIKCNLSSSLPQTQQESSSPPPSSFEAMIFNVDELFSWRTRSRKSVVDVGEDDDDASEARKQTVSANNSFSDHLDDHPLCHSYRSSPNNDVNDEINHHDIDSVASATASAAASSATPSPCVENDSEEDDDETEEDVASVYSNPIYLPPDFPITQESCGFLSATITLNLALANHLCGLELQELRDAPVSAIHEHLTSAGRYYEYTIRLERARQQEEQRRMTQASAVSALYPHPLSSSLLPPLFISPFALLVILNNLGQLHMSLSDKERSQKCYRQLQSTLMFLFLHDTKHSNSLKNNSKDMAVFMENATLGLQSMTSRPMAAAA